MMDVGQPVFTLYRRRILLSVAVYIVCSGLSVPIYRVIMCYIYMYMKKDKRKVQRVPQSQTAALPRHQEEEETDKSKQAQIE